MAALRAGLPVINFVSRTTSKIALKQERFTQFLQLFKANANNEFICKLQFTTKFEIFWLQQLKIIQISLYWQNLSYYKQYTKVGQDQLLIYSVTEFIGAMFVTLCEKEYDNTRFQLNQSSNNGVYKI